MLRRVSFVSYLEDAARNSPKVEEADLEEKSTSCCVVIPQQLRVSYFNTFIKLPQEVFIHRVRDPQLWDLLFISPRIQRQRKSS